MRQTSNLRLHFLLHMARQDFLERYSGSALGALWTLLLPLSQILIFTVIFGSIIGARLPGNSTTYGYGIYLVSGLLPWTAFSNTVLRTTTVFIDRKPILSKVYVPLAVVAAPIAISEGLTLIIGLSLLMVFLLITGEPLPSQIGFIPLLIILQQLFALGVGLILGAFAVFVRDIKELTGVGLQLWFWATPIVYVADILPVWAQQITRFNPAMTFVGPFHAIFGQRSVEAEPIGLLVAAAVGAMILSWFLLRLMEKHIRDAI